MAEIACSPLNPRRRKKPRYRCRSSGPRAAMLALLLISFLVFMITTIIIVVVIVGIIL